MGLRHPHVANHNQTFIGGLIMTDINIHNFQYFLNELEKNLNDMNFLIEQESMRLQNQTFLHNVMEKMCTNWLNQLKHQK